jgi:hypothetical protein
MVEVLGERIDARSDGRVIEAGSWVVVVRGDPTGYVVQPFDPDRPPPKLPNHGQPIRKAEFQLTRAEAALIDSREQTEARKRFRQGLRTGSVAAGKVGAAVGAGGGALGLVLGWARWDDPAGVATLFGLSLVVGVVAGVVLFCGFSLVGSALGEGDG